MVGAGSTSVPRAAADAIAFLAVLGGVVIAVPIIGLAVVVGGFAFVALVVIVFLDEHPPITLALLALFLISLAGCSLPNELRVTEYGAGGNGTAAAIGGVSGRVAGCRVSSKGNIKVDVKIDLPHCAVTRGTSPQ